MKIGEISKETGISEYTLRYYEKKGLIKVQRDNLDRREYSDEDIEWILFIKKLKDTGMILSEIKRYSDFRYLGDVTIEKRKNMLLIHRKTIEKEILKWNNYLDNIDKKIEIYSEKLK